MILKHLKINTLHVRFGRLSSPYDPGGIRTHDPRIKSPLLYQLSYRIAIKEGTIDSFIFLF